MPEPLIQIRDLSLQIAGKAILQKINLDIFPGDRLGLIGPNGAGKTSLIKCLAGIYRNWQGLVRAAGHDLRRCGRRALARAVSYAPQADECHIPFTCLEFVLMSRYPHLSPFTTLRRTDSDLAERCLTQTGTMDLRDRRIATLSGGERQMILIAAALAQGAPIMLLDEPAAFLDYHHQRRIMRLLYDLNHQHGLTIVIVSHDINAACRWSTRIAAMRDGGLMFCKTPEEVLRKETLAAVYDTPFTFVGTPNGQRLAIIEETAS